MKNMLVALTEEARYTETNDIVEKFSPTTRRKIMILLNHFDKFFTFDTTMKWWVTKGYSNDKDYHVFHSPSGKVEWKCGCINFIYKFGICSHLAAIMIYRLFNSDMKQIRLYVNYYRTKTIMKKRLVREMRRARRLESKIVVIK